MRLSLSNPFRFSPAFSDVLILFIIVCLSYARALQGGFMLDDFRVLLGEGGVIHMLFSDLFRDYQAGFYRPVGHVYMWLVSHWAGENPAAYHAANIVYFGVIVAVLYKLVYVLSGRRDLARLTALLYAIHPINSMLVNYITASVITTYVLFAQLTVLAFYYALTSPRRMSWYGVSLVCFLAALLSHEVAIMVPAFLFCAGYFTGKAKARQLGLSLVPYGLVATLYSVYKHLAFPFNSFSDSFSNAASAAGQTLTFVATYIDLLAWYTQKLFVPHNILFLYHAEWVTSGAWVRLGGFAFIVLMSLFLVFRRYKKGMPALGLILFWLGFLPAAVASFRSGRQGLPMIEPHWFYFSSMGFFLWVSWMLLEWKKRSPAQWRYGFPVLAIALIVLLNGNISHWRSQEAYCRYWLSLNPYNMTAYGGVAHALMDRGDFAGAAKVLREAMDSLGSFSVYLAWDLAYCEYKTGQQDSAVAKFQKIVRAKPSTSLPYAYLADIYEDMGRWSEAADLWATAVELFRENAVYVRRLTEARRRALEESGHSLENQ